MPDMEKVIKGFTVCSEHGLLNGEDCHGHYEYTDNLADIIKANDYSKQCPYNGCETGCVKTLAKDVFAILKEQDKLLRKLQKDKDKLCLEVSKWKHKFHDAPPKFVSQGVVDQIRWERDTALSQLEQIGKGLGSKMDDIVAILKEQEAVEPILIREGRNKNYNDYVCPRCDNEVAYEQNYCSECGVRFLWEGR